MPKSNEIVVGNFNIALNGKEFSEKLLSAVESITVEDEINLPAMFTIQFNTIDFFKGTWRGIELETFKLGDTVKVFMGIDRAVPMLTGEITTLEPVFGESSSMEIRGYDKLHRLRFGKYRRSFKKMKDSDIAKSIVSEIGLSPKVETTKTVYPYIFQNNLSNYEFLLERAARIGFEMLVEDKKFIFRKSQEGKKPVLTLKYGVDFNDFSAQLKTLTEGSKVEVRGWDVKNKKEITSTAASGSENSKMTAKESGYKLSQKAFGKSAISILDGVVVDAKDAESIAKARYNLILKQFLSGEGSCVGNPKIRAGKTIKIEGLGKRFSGVYYIISTAHSYNINAGYTTTFRVRRTGA